MPRDRASPSLTSHLFTVRVWREDMGESHIEWRGKVQHPLSGEARYFREWTELIAFVRDQVGDTDQVNQADTVRREHHG